MIVVTVEMWPHGIESKKYLLGRGTITNVGGDTEFGEYEAVLEKSAQYAFPGNVGKPYKRGHVARFPRARGPWALLRRALEACMV